MRNLIEATIFMLLLNFSSFIFLLIPLFNYSVLSIDIIRYVNVVLMIGWMLYFKNRWKLNLGNYITKESIETLLIIFAITAILFIATYPIAFPNRFVKYILNNEIYFFTTQFSFQEISIKTALYYFPLHIIGPIIEELIFRGLIQQKLYESYNPLKSILLTSVLFTLLHFPPERFFNIFLTGIFFGFIFHRFKSLSLSIFAHLSFNLFVSLTIHKGYEIDRVLLPLVVYYGLCSVLYIFIKNNLKYLKKSFN